ncbi:hypothetical protein EXU57_16150 [Segetibacter sp. 3557_3]|uniref:hypothetical protein n=1 Tax=Segetibacter sp. 3557_3 TaxID=2547429 RepID=UPI00105841B4|nr:hypothetical protein [Segetibacter sp. 3557_3]TDH24018.1 hypothetical protein EXU57_16150 [Segetibacter sp. 3557_3]
MKNAVYLTNLVLVLISIYLFNIAPPTTPNIFLFWALAILWLSCIPLYHFLLIGCEREAIPLMPVWSGFIVLSYSLPVFLIKPEDYEIYDVTAECLEYSFWSFLLFYIYYYCLYHTLSTKIRFTPIQFSVTGARCRFYALLFLLVNIVTSKVFSIDSIQFIGVLGFYFFVGTYIVLQHQKVRITTVEKVLFNIILLYEFIERVISGQILAFGLLFIFYVFVSYVLKAGMKKLVIVCVSFVLLYSWYSQVKYSYREFIWFSDKSYNFIERVQLLGDLAFHPEAYNAGPPKETEKQNSHIIWRFSYQASAFALIIDKTPRDVPFWEGSTYQVLAKFIPRILWPDKPLEDANLQYNKTYGLVPPEAEVSPFPLPTLAEMYMNFGTAGIVYGMFGLALLYYGMNSYFNSINNNPINKVYGIGILISYINIEGNFTMTFGVISLMILTLLALLYCFKLLADKLNIH